MKLFRHLKPQIYHRITPKNKKRAEEKMAKVQLIKLVGERSSFKVPLRNNETRQTLSQG